MTTTIEPKPYLEYLEKEMTIMGLLSAFSIALASFSTERIVTAEDGFLALLWEVGSNHILTGAALAVLAAFFFYLQRSHLAWHYGQIALAQSLGPKSLYKLEKLLADADGWESWTCYQTGFVVLTFFFGSYAYAVAGAIDTHIGSISQLQSLGLPLAIGALIVTIRWWIHVKYAQKEKPFKAWWQSFRKS